MEKLDYVSWLRQRVGHNPVILVCAGGLLVNAHNQVLLQRRTDFNGWGLPGGVLEYGESAAQACEREYLEETGLRVRTQSLFGVSSHQIQRYPNGDTAQTVVVEFLVTAVGGQLNTQNSETRALAYFDYDQLPPIFSSQHQASLDHYFQGTYPYYD